MPQIVVNATMYNSHCVMKTYVSLLCINANRVSSCWSPRSAARFIMARRRARPPLSPLGRGTAISGSMSAGGNGAAVASFSFLSITVTAAPCGIAFQIKFSPLAGPHADFDINPTLISGTSVASSPGGGRVHFGGFLSGCAFWGG
jgi:hypothetical protein